MNTNQTFRFDNCDLAAAKGDLETLKKLHLAGYEWNTNTTKYAATEGHLECLKYLFENGCPWDIQTCNNAAASGRLDCLRYAHQNGCPVSELTATNTTYYDRIECLQYLYENGCPIDFHQAATFAVLNSMFKTFKFCFEKCNSDQKLWDKLYNSWNQFNLPYFVEELNLDDPVWRKLLHIDLSTYPLLQSKVEKKRKEIEKLKEDSKITLEIIFPSDIIKYCIYPFF